jgi:hypothetical protein
MILLPESLGTSTTPLELVPSVQKSNFALSAS